MSASDSSAAVQSLMLGFADRTGLSTSVQAPRRYLWTDAFAVCNFLDLYLKTGMDMFRDLAVALIDQVHETLGRHRPDDERSGWISGLTDEEGRRHPTAGGLRIGKALPERRPEEARNDHLEWDQDGQYFHYLTKWMHALHRAFQITGHADFDRFARELAQTAHARFTYTPASGGPKRMYWKMSIDLSRPLVLSMGQHDPLDGLITYHELNATLPQTGSVPGLQTEIDELATLCRHQDWTTDDPLGIGGLLADAFRTGQLTVKGAAFAPELMGDILSSALTGLQYLYRQSPFILPPGQRLAFRELGLSIGLRAAVMLKGIPFAGSFKSSALLQQLEDITRFARLSRFIEDFWQNPDNQQADTWTAHRDINEVMLATSLAPEGFLTV